jgi:hypothetical protein
MARFVQLTVMISFILIALRGTGLTDEKDQAKQEQKAQRGPLEGTWEHTFENAPAQRQLKIINQTHYVWVTYRREDGRPLVLGGGTYTFDGKTYKEKPEFGGPGLPVELIGKEQTFTAEIKADEWTHSGTLSNGFRVREVWRRVK